MLWIRKARGVAVLCAASFGLCSTSAWAQPAATTVQGEIKSFTSAPKGETDGAILTDGSYIHWPPHFGERVSSIVKIGDSLETSGRWETGPEGDRRFEANQVMNVSTKARVDMGPGRPGPRGELGPRRGDATTRNGRIKELTTAPKGEIDGAVLNDGTVIHWPPHLEVRFRKIAAVGVDVRVAGVMDTTPKGDSHFEVQSLTNLETNQTAINDDAPPAPRGPRSEPVGASKESRIERLRDLQRQLDRIQREMDELLRSE